MIKTACEDLWKYQADNLISCTFIKDEKQKTNTSQKHSDGKLTQSLSFQMLKKIEATF